MLCCNQVVVSTVARKRGQETGVGMESENPSERNPWEQLGSREAKEGV